MRVACLAVLLAACTPDGTYVLITVDRAPGVPDGITSIDLSLTLAGQMADAKVQEVGLTFPTDLVLDVGNGAGELDIAATAATADGTTVATGATTGTVTRGQKTEASLILMSSAVTMLSIDRASYDFGTLTTGATSGPVTFIVTNNGTDPSGAVSANVAGDAAAFEVTGCTGPALPPNTTCTLSVTFKPTAAGSFHITASVAATPGGMVSADITGTAVAPSPITISPSPNSYGDVLDGVSVPQTFTVTNGGTMPTGALTTSITGSDAAQFVASADGCSGQVLAVNATCTLTVTFTPSGTTGARAASLTVSGSPGGTAVAPLAGRALTAAMIALSASSNDFGTIDVGMATALVDFVLTNTGGQTTGTLTTTTTGSTADFVVDMDACNGQTLIYLGTCTISGHFAPASFGPKSLTVAINGSPGGTASMTWTGVGHDTVTLTVVTPFGGDGGGDITATGINCPTGVCSVVIDRSGATTPSLTLVAAPHIDSNFVSWSGDCSGTSTMCMLTMDGNKSVTPSFNKKRFDLLVAKTNVGTASGTITSVTSPSESSEINCGSTCDVQRIYNDMVTLTATPAAGFYFGGWSGDCSGDTPTCALTMTAAHTATATFTPANRIFTTNATYTQAQVQSHGTGTTNDAKMLSGADAICASAGGAGSSWKSVLVTSSLVGATYVPLSRLKSTSRGWVRWDGLPFGDTVSSIYSSFVIYNPPSITETGARLGDTEGSWTGWAQIGSYTVESDCGNWTDATATTAFTAGLAAGGSGLWLGDGLWPLLDPIWPCSGSYHVLCMEDDYHAVLPAATVPAGSRRIFNRTVSGNAGLASFDTSCNTGLTGSFLALVATNGNTAASRFTARGAPIVRLDGVVVSDTDTDFFSGKALWATPGGDSTYAIFGTQPAVFTGASAINVAGTTTSTCYNGTTSWSSSSGSATVGCQPEVAGSWFDCTTASMLSGGDACSNTALIYCLEE